jgi:uncharacterized protein (TIGR02996 family)
MTDGDALLRAIQAEPEEDTPRLAYADWLDEQGGNENVIRARFIRLQCAQAAGTLSAAEEQELHELESAFEDVWAEPLKALLGEELTGVGFERGFPERLRLYPKHVRRTLEKLRGQVVTKINLSLPDQVRPKQWHNLPEQVMTQLRAMHLDCRTSAVTTAFSKIQQPMCLRSLSLSECPIDGPHMRRLLSSPPCASLNSQFTAFLQQYSRRFSGC